MNKKTVTKALEEEREYFSKHPVYSSLPAGHVGTEVLTQKLTKVLYAHIRTLMPEIMNELKLKINECDERMKDLGPALPSSDSEKFHMLWGIVSQFVAAFKNQIQGQYDGSRSTKLDDKSLNTGAKIRQIFVELYSEYKGYEATSEYSDEDIKKAIQLHEGDSIPGR